MTRATLTLLFSLSVAATLVAVILAIFTRDMNRVRTAVDHGAQIASTTVGPIQYAETGEGVPLLSIHGSGGGFDQGLANVAEVIGERYRIIAPSRFGYLATPIPADASSTAQAEAHVALLNYLKIDRVIVVGVSAGAVSALELALRHPDRVEALILMVPATYAPRDPVAIEASPSSKAAFNLVNTGADFLWWCLEKIAPNLLIRFIGVPPDVVAASPQIDQDRVRRIVRSIQPLSQRVAGINIDSTTELRRLPLETIRTPTLVISAEDDLFNTRSAAEFAAQEIPTSSLVIFKTGGHLLVGRTRELREIFHSFLTGLPR